MSVAGAECLLVVVAFRSEDDLPELLGSVPAAAGDRSWRVIVVDNDAAGTADYSAARRAGVDIIRSGANLGYAGGINVGMRRAEASEYVMFLNPDLVLEPGAIETLIAECERSRGAAAVPLVVGDGGERQNSLRREPTILTALGDALFGDRWGTRPALLSGTVRSSTEYASPARVDWATGAALLVRRSVADEVGDWDEGRFFLYSEETDFCRRIRELGHSIAFVPTAVVKHRGAGSGSSASLDALLIVNKVRYYRKWHGSGASGLFTGIAILHCLLRLWQPAARSALGALVSPRARARLPGGRA